MSITNYSTAIFLVNKDARAVHCSYEQDPVTNKGKHPFTIFKTLDPTVKEGEFVVVPTDTRHGMTVVRVEEIHGSETVDLDSGVQMKWVIDHVHTEAYEALLAQEKAAIETIKSAELNRRREELREKLLADNPDLRVLQGLSPDGAITALPSPAAPTE